MRAAVVVSIVAAFVTVACGPIDGHCSPGASCGGPPSYDLVLTEADSGKAGISMGGGVAFLLDSGHNRLVTTPALKATTLDDPTNQFPGKHAFSLPAYQFGVFDVVATGSDSTPFTFHLVIGRSLPFPYTYGTVLHRGDLVVQEYSPSDQPPPLRSPTFDHLLDAMSVGMEGRLLNNQAAMPRRAYRAAQFGAQLLSTRNHGYFYRVVVADTPPIFHNFVDTANQYPGGQIPYPLYLGAGDRFAVIVTGDAQQFPWTSKPADAVVRLPDADIGPQAPGVTLVPFRLLVEGKVTLEVRTRSKTISVPIASGFGTCLPDDFPRFPLAITTGFSGQGQCEVDMTTSDPVAQVLSFYSLRLNEGDWHATSAGGSALKFARRSNSATAGTLEIDGGGIHIRMNREVPTPSPIIG
jgi:hypothetical protein